jgi:hypothetical protein
MKVKVLKPFTRGNKHHQPNDTPEFPEDNVAYLVGLGLVEVLGEGAEDAAADESDAPAEEKPEPEAEATERPEPKSKPAKKRKGKK